MASQLMQAAEACIPMRPTRAQPATAPFRTPPDRADAVAGSQAFGNSGRAEALWIAAVLALYWRRRRLRVL